MTFAERLYDALRAGTVPPVVPRRQTYYRKLGAAVVVEYTLPDNSRILIKLQAGKPGKPRRATVGWGTAQKMMAEGILPRA